MQQDIVSSDSVILISEPKHDGQSAGAHLADAETALDDLVFTLTASFRRHPHLNNVLTHISGGQWPGVERALRAILDPGSRHVGMSPLALNILDLMCADRGITGRILKPFFRGILFLKLAPPTAQRLISHVDNLFEDSTRASVSAGSEEVTSEQPGESTADISVSRRTA